MSSTDECKESYEECTAARHQRAVRVVKDAQPGDKVKELAERAGVSTPTIKRIRAELLQTGSPEPNCNKEPKEKPSYIGWSEDLIVNRWLLGYCDLKKRKRKEALKILLKTMEPTLCKQIISGV